ncbi:hypothetical protein HRI_000016000 [Hibiscus trionum]|uniref:RNase H type-1 domain-containing protein n=1 Tax=Hibiscus trionum TaxID=183268 RepID=A0A9W7LGF2_HIBTR|nr:hypothetical protein HRI_000016000 [Hibiscus trionum]
MVPTDENTYPEGITKHPTHPTLEEQWALFVDGSYSKDSAGTGILLIHPLGNEWQYSLSFEFCAPNNVVKYEALIVVLELALKLGVQKMILYTDSPLVSKQVLQKYEVKDLTLL